VTQPTVAGRSTPLTILFAPAHTLVDSSQEGSEYYWAYKLIERLALDYGVRVIALTVQARVERPLPGVTFVSVDPGAALPVSNLQRLRFHLRVFAAARRILRREQSIDVAHHMLPFGFRGTFNVLALQGRRRRPPVVIGPLQPPLAYNAGDELAVSVRDFSATYTASPSAPPVQMRRAVPSPSAFITTPILSLLSGETLRRADALVAISERAVAAFRTFDPARRFDVIPVGVDTKVFTPRQGTSELVVGVGPTPASGKTPVTVVAVGYLVQRKAFDVLIEAVASVIGRGHAVRLRLVGDGPARGYLEALARERGIVESVTFVGRIPHGQIVAEYHAADIFCSSSRSEGFATVALEALACGLPIVATPTGGFRELLRQRDVGTLVGFDDVVGMANALARLAADPALRAAQGRRGRGLAVEEYDWSVIAGHYVRLYERLAHRRA